MPSRKRPQDALGVNRIFGIAAAAILFIPCLVEAQQQGSSVLQRQEEARRLEVTRIASPLGTPDNGERRKAPLSVTHEQLLDIKKDNDVSAIATSRQSANGGISQHTARKLEDWEVEDFVLLATVDGRLHARDRKTGRERWNLIHEKPMVQTKYHRRTDADPADGYTGTSLEDYLWIVEPSRDGSLYYYNPSGPDRGLVNTGLTMKKIVDDMSPYRSEDPDVSYSGGKTTSMVTIDAITGDVVKSFGFGERRPNSGRCPKSNTFLDKGECSPNATLSIGRSEYTVIIHNGKTEDPIATLTFSEWIPNNYDRDLHSQYHSTLDQKYIYASHDGSIIGLDHAENTFEEPRRLFAQKLSSPVVRVFDIARPWGTDKSDAMLVVLPQPSAPIDQDDTWKKHPLSSVFLNHTEDGSWYAMSGMTYPYAVQGVPKALVSSSNWALNSPAWDIMNESDLHEALVGLHSIDYRTQQDLRQKNLRTISAPVPEHNQSIVTSDNSLSPEASFTFDNYVQIWRARLRDFLGSSWFVSFIMIVLYSYSSQVTSQFQRLLAGSRVESQLRALGILPAKKEKEHNIEIQEPQVIPGANLEADKAQDTDSLAVAHDAIPSQPEETKDVNVDVVSEPSVPAVLPEVVIAEEPKPKKAHRGRRGGLKHKKGPKPSENSQDGNPVKPPPTVDDAVRNAQTMGQEQEARLEPDIKTVSTDPNEVSGPIIRVGALEVDTEKLIGSGSNGTMVFQGKFDGRDVAVKRMLMHYFDIASQETKLLRESDDHENVIRYYAQQQAAGFLYIALELCPASLADVIEKPHLHRELAQKGEQDLPHVLYQITNGIQYLHSLRIVHRDLKPQNILVNTHKDGRPRLLVSDFGLCKKLDGEQSSFRATTAHAAGTSGWRAPELLLDDDANHAGLAMVDASTDGNSGPLINAELLPNRRATRAIDIFSLGLVFFYVLTKGSHPFDCGDRYMREVNIRKGVFNLGLLEVLGDYAFEANDLIGSMLQAEPKRRPQARDVLSHPFFWKAKTRLNFLCDVSDHFEKEKRDPPSPALQELERYAQEVCGPDFLKPLGREFVESMGKQRKYTGTRLLDLLRALRNKKNHYEDMTDHLKEQVGPLPDGYLSFWTRKFPNLLITCWNVVYELQWDDTDRFKEYYQPAGL